MIYLLMQISIILLLFTLIMFLINNNNLIYILIYLEILLIIIGLLFILISFIFDDLIGNIFTLFILPLAGAESAFGLVLIINFYPYKGNLNTNN